MFIDIITIISIVIVNILKIIYSIFAVLITLLFDYNEGIIKRFLENLNVYGSCEGLEKYYEFKKNHTNGVALFTHTSYFDGIILLNELKEAISFVVLKDALILNTYKLAKKWNCLIIEEKQKNTETITKKILERKKNDPLLLIAPAGDKGMIQENEYELCEFRTGAFVSKSPVLPILINYSPHIYCTENTDRFKYILSLINREKLYYKVTILDPIFPEENDTIESFKNRVYKKMNEEKNKIKINENEIYIKKNNNTIVNLILILLILSYLLFTNIINEKLVVVLVLIIFSILYLKNKHYIYDYIYNNLIYIYGSGLGIYSIFTKNILLFINSIIYPLLYKIINNKIIK